MSLQQPAAEAIKAYQAGATELVIHGMVFISVCVHVPCRRGVTVHLCCRLHCSVWTSCTGYGATGGLIESVATALAVSKHVEILEIQLVGKGGCGGCSVL